MKHREIPKDRRQVNIRIARVLYERIEKDAQEQKRSVSSHVAYIIEGAMTREPAEARRG